LGTGLPHDNLNRFGRRCSGPEPETASDTDPRPLSRTHAAFPDAVGCLRRGVDEKAALQGKADPTKPVSTLGTAWDKVRELAGVTGRWHDNRHTLVTELSESGAGDAVIMSIAGTSRAQCYCGTGACGSKRNGAALDEIAVHQRAADRKRQREIARQRQLPEVSISAVVH
jgi:hypothetical protein